MRLSQITEQPNSQPGVIHATLIEEEERLMIVDVTFNAQFAREIAQQPFNPGALFAWGAQALLMGKVGLAPGNLHLDQALCGIGPVLALIAVAQLPAL